MRARTQLIKSPPKIELRARVQVDEVEIFHDVEQGSDEWFALRLGMVTASVLSSVLAKSEGMKMRTKLLYRLAGERLSGEPAESYSNAFMERGKVMEAEARQHYAFTRGVDLRRVGFVRRTIHRGLYEPLVVGCSPDALVDEIGVLEIKTMAPHLMVELADRGTFPSEHRAQIHGGLWITGCQYCDLVVFYRGMPIRPTFRIERDENFIREIQDAVEVFDYDLRRLVEKIRGMA